MRLSYKHLFVFTFFIFLTILLTWPLLLHIQNGFISPAVSGDAPINIWNVYLFKSSVKQGINPFFTHHVFAPDGANLIMHGYMPAMCLFSMLFSNALLGMNIYLMIHFVLSAFGAYLLSFKLTRHTLVSVLVGIAFSFSAYKMLRLTEHYMLVLTATIPFYIISFLNAFEFKEGFFFPSIRSFRYVLLCMLLGVLTVLNDYYSTFYLIYFSIAWLLYYKLVLYWKKWNWEKRILIVGAFFIGMHLLIEPLYHSGIDDRGGIWWGGDLISYIIPNMNSWLWNRDFFSGIFPRLFELGNNLEFQQFIGYSMVLLVLYIIYTAIRQPVSADTGAWIFMFILFILISLPVIKVAGTKLIYSPTSILHFIPFFNNVRCNTRIEVLITLVLPLAAAIIWSRSRVLHTSVFYSNSMLIVFAACIVADLKPDSYIITKTQSIPAIYTDVKHSDGTVLTSMPVGIGDGIRHEGEFHTMDLFYQTYHHKNLSGGYISRVPESTFTFFLQDNVMNTLLTLSRDKNAVFSIPSKEESDTYFKRFKTDLFLIEPEYRQTNAEKYIDAVIADKKYRSVEKENYRLIILE